MSGGVPSSVTGTESVGWVIVGDADEDLRGSLRPGEPHLWADARTRGKVRGQPVLFLQSTQDGRAHWVGSGFVLAPEERWKSLGVWIQCVRVRPASQVAPGRSTNGAPGPMEDVPLGPMDRWENRSLASRLGVPGFRMRTPYLEDGRDIRVTAADRDLLFRFFPALREWWKEAQASSRQGTTGRA